MLECLKTVDLLRDDARDLYQADLALIRPDQIVAWRGNSDEAGAEIIEGVLGLRPAGVGIFPHLRTRAG